MTPTDPTTRPLLEEPVVTDPTPDPAPVATGLDAVVDPAALTVDPAEGVVRVDPATADAAPAPTGHTRAEEVAAVGAMLVGLAAAAATDRAATAVIDDDRLRPGDVIVATPAEAEILLGTRPASPSPEADSPAWHAARLAEDPRLGFHLHGSSLQDLLVTADRVGLPQPYPSTRNALAHAVKAHVHALTGTTDTAPDTTTEGS